MEVYNSNALDKVNVKPVPKTKQNKPETKKRKALLSVVVFANSLMVLLAGMFPS